jgi:hypothetical protein
MMKLNNCAMATPATNPGVVSYPNMIDTSTKDQIRKPTVKRIQSSTSNLISFLAPIMSNILTSAYLSRKNNVFKKHHNRDTFIWQQQRMAVMFLPWQKAVEWDELFLPDWTDFFLESFAEFLQFDPEVLGNCGVVPENNKKEVPCHDCKIDHVSKSMSFDDEGSRVDNK